MENSKIITKTAAIAAVYVLLSFLAQALSLSSGVVQIRISEAMCVLPCFLAEAVGGLTLGCFLFNLMSGATLADVIFGTLATFLGAYFTRMLKSHRYLSLMPPIISNTLIIPFVLKYSYGFSGSVLYFMASVGLGEIISVGVLGSLLYSALSKLNIKF